MAFSHEWEEAFSQKKNFSEYPWSNLVSLVMRYANPAKVSFRPRVLELGCGVGANIGFFIDKGFDYRAIEGSQSAVSYINKKFGDAVTIVCHDFTKNIPYENDYFDLIVDRGSTTHNCSSEIQSVVSEVRRCLKKDHFFIVVDWFSIENYGLNEGEKLEPHTITNCKRGYLAGLGLCHFFDENELKVLFSKWEIIYLMKKISLPYLVKKMSFELNSDLREAAWDLVVKNVK